LASPVPANVGVVSEIRYGGILYVLIKLIVGATGGTQVTVKLPVAVFERAPLWSTDW
jgi:hypothetical protein